MTGQASWAVEEGDSDWRPVYNFLHGISGAPTPDGAEYDTVYVVEDDGETIGMAAVDTFSRPLVYAVGVRNEYRERGVGSALLQHCLDEHDRVYCRVRKDNPAGIALCESVGMTREESMWPHELWQYEADA